MKQRRVIVLNERTEAALSTVCDVALKFGGMYMATIVSDVILSIRDQEMNQDEDE